MGQLQSQTARKTDFHVLSSTTPPSLFQGIFVREWLKSMSYLVFSSEQLRRVFRKGFRQTLSCNNL